MTTTHRRRGVRLLLAAVLAVAAGLWAAIPAFAAASITVDKTEGLNPKGDQVTVSGSGFKPGIQLYLVTCDPAIPNGGACDLASFSMVDVGADGSWTSKLKVLAKFGTTDCLKVGCAIQTSRVGEGADRTQETLVPIGFKGQTAPMASPTATPASESASPTEPASPSATAEPTAPATPTTTDAASDATASSSGVSPVVWIVVAVVVIAALAGGLVAMSRRSSDGR